MSATNGNDEEDFRNENVPEAGGTTRPPELAASIQQLAAAIAAMRGVELSAEDRITLEQLIATLAKLLQ